MEQFKTLEDLREYIKDIGSFYARPTTRGEHPTLYEGKNDGEHVCGIRKRDYLFSACGKWVLPCNSMGLSFSAHWQHLKNVYRLKSTRNGGKPVDVYWVLETADIPSGLKFIVDPNDKKKQHYFLIVTEQMRVERLVRKFQWMADRMSKIKNAQAAL